MRSLMNRGVAVTFLTVLNHVERKFLEDRGSERTPESGTRSRVSCKNPHSPRSPLKEAVTAWEPQPLINLFL